MLEIVQLSASVLCNTKTSMAEFLTLILKTWIMGVTSENPGSLYLFFSYYWILAKDPPLVRWAYTRVRLPYEGTHHRASEPSTWGVRGLDWKP